jgi:oligopeptide/dipeptide ABC transporter ATP-binding protein
VSGVLLRAEALSKQYRLGGSNFLRGRKGLLSAVDDVSLDIAAGETLGLVGESGCGKSTLGRLLIRLLPASGGRVLFDGADITKLSAAAFRVQRAGMQIIFQDPYGALDPRMSVEDIVMEPLRIQGRETMAQGRLSVARMLDLVGLSATIRHRYPHEFSGGQRQRIGIARALILNPRFVVCDEPVSALDVSVQAQIINLLQDLQAELGLTFLFIAHDLGVVKHISTRVAVMYLGRVVEVADKATLFRAPLHPYTQAMIAAVPVLHPALRRPRVRLSGDVPSALDPPPGCRFHTRCPHAMPVCRQDQPPLVPVAPHHEVACYLYPSSATIRPVAMAS